MADIEFPAVMRRVTYSTENCGACMLNKQSKLPLYGRGGKKILIVFEKQEAINQTSKTYAVGSKFDFVKDFLEENNIYMDTDCWVTSAIQCYSTSIEYKQAQCCKPALQRTIKMLKPELVIAFGDLTCKMLLEDNLDGVSIDLCHGLLHNSRNFNCNMLFTFSPHTARKNSKTDDIDALIIKSDLRVALNSLKTPYKAWKDEKECVTILTPKQSIQWLKNEINNTTKRYVAFDYECNSLRGYSKASKIVCVSIATDLDTVHVFDITDENKNTFIEWLKTDHLIKIAHNSAYERQFSINKLGVNPHKLHIDTMLLAHILDNREINWFSIKFLAKMLLGTPEWETNTKKLLKASKKDDEKYGSYALNKIDLVPKRQLLTYCGVDSLVELRVASIFLKQLNNFYGDDNAADN